MGMRSIPLVLTQTVVRVCKNIAPLFQYPEQRKNMSQPRGWSATPQRSYHLTDDTITGHKQKLMAGVPLERRLGSHGSGRVPLNVDGSESDLEASKF